MDTHKRLAGLMVVGAMVLAVASASAPAAVILSNLPGTASAGSILGGPNNQIKAIGLTTGNASLQFTSMEVLVGSNAIGGDLIGGIYSDVGGEPTAPLAAFTPIAIAGNTPTQLFTLTTTDGFMLEANTSYWFFLSDSANDSTVAWAALAPSTAPTATGVTFDGYKYLGYHTSLAWLSSSVYNSVRINAEVPEPATAAVLGLAAATVGLRRRRRSA